ncbi:hypothetical protein Ddc_15717 [Ditylenchus destructor]|nr:hypothetical protein Ddc_15717 [Ditylenchus destructor]
MDEIIYYQTSPTSTVLLEAALNDEQVIGIDDMFGDEQLCGEYENYTLARFLFLSISSSIALFGVVANIFLCILFSTTNCQNTPPTLYPRVLAVLDAIICAVYILLFGADAAVVYLHIKSLFTLYHVYIVPAFVASRIAQIAIPYMLIFATLERFVWIAGNMRNRVLKSMYSVHGRYVTVAVSLAICVALRLPTAWATTVYDYPKCQDFFRSKTAAAAPWVRDNLIYHVYDFHLLSIAQTVVPFFVLLTFNAVTVKKLSKMKLTDNNLPNGQYRNSSTSDRFLRLSEPSTDMIQPERSLSVGTASLSCDGRLSCDGPSLTTPLNNHNLMRKSFSSIIAMNSPVKSAIYTMVCIVASYLVSNTLHLILTILERSNSDLLKHPTDPNLASTFHTAFSDIVSFVYMFTSAMRVLIYYLCNPTIRGDINASLKQMCTNMANKVSGVQQKKSDTSSTML